jgi:hypothetical protein
MTTNAACCPDRVYYFCCVDFICKIRSAQGIFYRSFGNQFCTSAEVNRGQENSKEAVENDDDEEAGSSSGPERAEALMNHELTISRRRVETGEFAPSSGSSKPLFVSNAFHYVMLDGSIRGPEWALPHGPLIARIRQWPYCCT